MPCCDSLVVVHIMCPVVAGAGGRFTEPKSEQRELTTKSLGVQSDNSIKGDVHSPFLPSIPLATAFLNVNYFMTNTQSLLIIFFLSDVAECSCKYNVHIKLINVKMFM